MNDTSLAIFADDTAVITSSWNTNTVLQRIQKHEFLGAYFDKWKRKINATKTELIVFSSDKQTQTVNLFENQIQTAPTRKYLGVHLDQKLKFGSHLTKTKNKAQGAMHKLFLLLFSDNINVKNKLLIYKVIIRPIMLYACPIWGGVAAKCHIDKLQRVQNKCIRLA